MGRAKASHICREFSITFANVVSVPSNAKNDWIAKNGCFSLFKLLSTIAPMACRSPGGDRHGISEAELNKALESNGFTRVRVRLRSIVASAGTLLFDARRWLNPNSESDLHLLLRAFGALRASFPQLLTCDEAFFLRTVARHRDEWVLRTRSGGRAAAEALCRSSVAPYSAIICAPSRSESNSCASSRRSSESTCTTELASDPSELSDAETPVLSDGRHNSSSDAFDAGFDLAPQPFRLRGLPPIQSGFMPGWPAQHGWPSHFNPNKNMDMLAAVSECDEEPEVASSAASCELPASTGTTRRRGARSLDSSECGGRPLASECAGTDDPLEPAHVAEYLRKRFFAACLAGQLLPPPSQQHTLTPPFSSAPAGTSGDAGLRGAGLRGFSWRQPDVHPYPVDNFGCPRPMPSGQWAV